MITISQIDHDADGTSMIGLSMHHAQLKTDNLSLNTYQVTEFFMHVIKFSASHVVSGCKVFPHDILEDDIISCRLSMQTAGVGQFINKLNQTQPLLPELFFAFSAGKYKGSQGFTDYVKSAQLHKHINAVLPLKGNHCPPRSKI